MRSTSRRRFGTSADRLSEYCGEGTYAYLLDRETTVQSDARLVVFDTRRCPDSELRTVMFSIDGVRHHHSRAALEGAEGRGHPTRERHCFKAGRSC